MGVLCCNFQFVQGVLCKIPRMYCASFFNITPFAKKKNMRLRGQSPSHAGYIHVQKSFSTKCSSTKSPKKKVPLYEFGRAM